MQKKILIIDQGLLSKEIELLSNSEVLINVLYVNLPENKYPYSFLDKYINIINRVFLNNNNYPQNKEYNYNSNSYLNDFRNNKKKEYYDHVLITRPDNFNSNFLSEVSKITNNIVGYMWDTISDDKYNRLINNRKYFKNLYCYDKKSIEKYPSLNLRYTSNFYYPISDLDVKNKDLFLSYIGNHLDGRKDLILKILNSISLINKDIKIVLVERTKNLLNSIYIFDNFTITSEKVKTEEYLQILSNSIISLDLIPSFNNGFSFRLFEATYVKTKLITTNQTAKELQFYHPNNIFIYNEETKHLLNDFINKPFIDVDKDLIEYYRFDNWLYRILKLK